MMNKSEKILDALSKIIEEAKKPENDDLKIETIGNEFLEFLHNEMPDEIKGNFIETTTLRAELINESDRGAALFLSSYIDQRLGRLLSGFMVKEDSISTPFVYGSGPISTFSSRIDLCYLLGLISKQERHDLNIIRKIRNDFAHTSSSISFKTQSIRDRCANFITARPHTSRGRGRAEYTSVAMALLARIDATSRAISNIPEKTDFNEVNKKMSIFWDDLQSREQ